MPSDMTPTQEQTAATIRTRLLSRHHAPLVCGPDTNLVIEGYPRSANSFLMWMLDVVQEGHRPLSIGHHTHSVDNLRLALHYGTPAAILIREPEAAILSYMIYETISAEEASARYIAFYTKALALPRIPKVIPFETVTTDFNRVIAWVNQVTKADIPFSDDLERERQKAYAMAQSRAADIHGSRIVEQIAIPSQDREALKQGLRSDLTAYLAGRSDIAGLYQQVMSQAQI